MIYQKQEQLTGLMFTLPTLKFPLIGNTETSISDFLYQDNFLS